MSAGRDMKRRTKIAVLIGTLEVGGAERDIVRNFPLLSRDEFEVVVVLFGHPGALAPELERQGVRYVARLEEPGDTREGSSTAANDSVAGAPAGEPLGLRLRRWVRTYRVLAPIHWVGSRLYTALYIARVTRWVGRTFKRERVDIAHFFLPHSYAYGMVACFLWSRNTRTVMSRLSLNFYKHERRVLAWLESHVLHRRVDIAVGNSRLILQELVDEGVPSDRTRLLYNGIDLAPFERHGGEREHSRAAFGIDQAAFVMVAVGNLYAYKGHRDLIEACADLGDRLPTGWQLLIAGRDQEGNRAAYEALITERGLSGHVHLLGPRDDIAEILFAADVFVQPSLHEGLPNAIIEAMAASLPVIGTAVGGIPEVVTATGGGDSSPDTGWLVPPRDRVALATTLVEAARDPGRRRRTGANARERAEAEFSVQRSVSDYESIYRELLS